MVYLTIGTILMFMGINLGNQIGAFLAGVSVGFIWKGARRIERDLSREEKDSSITVNHSNSSDSIAS